MEAVGRERIGRKHLISAIGVAIALVWIFPNYGFLHLPPMPGFVFSVLLKTFVMLALIGIGVGLRHRPWSFYQVRRFGAADLVSVPAVMLLIVMVVGAVMPADPGEPKPGGALWLGLIGALSAGVCEEFIYRGYLIEELGELVNSRGFAGIVSVIVFALAHIHNAGVRSVWDVWPQFMLGLFLTALYFRKQNLLLCMMVHVSIDIVDDISRRLN